MALLNWLKGNSSLSRIPSSLSKGSRFTFGRWGGEPVEWRVLDVSNGRALLISEKVIDCRTYHDRYVYITWEDCSLRRWLNGPFLQGAFNETERASIELTTVSNPDNARYETYGGADTRDSVFCLSIDEARKHFRDDEDRKAMPTAKAVANRVYFTNMGTSLWWLRSPGIDRCEAADITGAGRVREDGSGVLDDSVGVRPAMWINL